MNDTAFTGTMCYHSTNPIYSLVARDGSASATYFHSIVFQFNGSVTPATGSYKITPSLSGPANEIYLAANIYDNGLPVNFVATGNGNQMVTVSASDDKLTISLPEVWAKIDGARDSVKIYAQQIKE